MKLFGMTINVCTVSIFVFSLKTLNLTLYLYVSYIFTATTTECFDCTTTSKY